MLCSTVIVVWLNVLLGALMVEKKHYKVKLTEKDVKRQQPEAHDAAGLPVSTLNTAFSISEQKKG